MLEKIKDIKDEGKFISFQEGAELCIHYYDRDKVSSWTRDISVEIFEEKDLFWPYYIKNRENQQRARARKIQNYEFVPKDKFDFETIDKIKRADIKDIELVLPELFEWTEDCNWPIARVLAIELAKFGEYIIPFVKYYLSHSTGLDEYCMYYDIMPLLKKTDLEAIKPDLLRLATAPTDFEKNEEYDKFAQEYLNKIENR